jgi:hypothetical protein
METQKQTTQTIQFNATIIIHRLPVCLFCGCNQRRNVRDTMNDLSKGTIFQQTKRNIRKGRELRRGLQPCHAPTTLH